MLGCLLAVVLAGCTANPPGPDDRSRPLPTAPGAAPAWEALQPDQPRARKWTGGVTAVASVRPGLPNAGLPLPRVSPDGRWVAFLDLDQQSPSINPDQWITGRRLGGVALWLRGVDDEGLARNLAVSHAAWPTWSPDGRTLAFISNPPNDAAALMLHDVAAATTRRLSVGLRHLLMPAVSPDATAVAVSAYGDLPEQAVLFLIDPQTTRATPGPPPTLGGAQLFPHWLDDRTLLFVELASDPNQPAGLMRWTVGQSAAQPVAPLDLPTSIFDATATFAGIPRPVSPDQARFAYYAAADDRIHLLTLATAQRQPLRAGDRAGAWWIDQWFLVANDQQLQLVDISNPAESIDDQPTTTASPTPTEPPRMNLLPGRWAPRWTDPRQGAMLLVGQGETPDRFTFLQVWATTR